MAKIKEEAYGFYRGCITSYGDKTGYFFDEDFYTDKYFFMLRFAKLYLNDRYEWHNVKVYKKYNVVEFTGIEKN